MTVDTTLGRGITKAENLENATAPNEQTDLASDPMTAYLELALKIYLRIKNEGRLIHRPEFDDETDRLYDQTAGRA